MATRRASRGTKPWSSDRQWYTHVAALQRSMLPPDEVGRRLTERVVAVAGRPQDRGAPAPDPDIRVAGHSLAQSWLEQVHTGQIVCRPGIAAVEGRTVTFTDGSREAVDVVVCATGYALEIPCLDEAVWRVVGPELRLHVRTPSPDLPGLGFVGQFPLQGPSLPSSSCGPGSSCMPGRGRSLPTRQRCGPLSRPRRRRSTPTTRSVRRWRPGLVEPLLFGPMLPSRYRLNGPGALPAAATDLQRELARSPRAPVDPSDVADLIRLGLRHLGVGPLSHTTAL